MKTYFIWLRLLMKRMLKKPAFMLFLLILPLMSFLIDRLGQSRSEGMVVGLVLEAEEQGGTGDERVQQEFLSVLREQEGVLQFLLYEDEKKMRQDVEKGELDCGVFLREDLWEGLNTGAWQDTITLYTTSSSSMTEIVKEKIASVVFTFYSEKNYVNYIAQSEVFAAAEETSARTDIVSFAKAAYETHLLDGSTFAFQYRGDSGNNSLMSDELPERALAFRLRGILGVCIFLSGLCGLLTDWKDREEKRFVRFAPPVLTTMVNVWLPTLYTSVIALFSLLLTGRAFFSGDSGGMAGILTGLVKEIGALVFYQFLIVLYCSIIRVVLKKQEMIAAAIPFLTLASIVCCPVWIRLAVYLPFFRVLEKFFPVTYYLLI
ncbi:MAG: hypothetical protein HDR27_06475 [Lachnospiraceae bacterium]|nr:hypothetical protein [Lachnospiraceae bacterium]